MLQENCFKLDIVEINDQLKMRGIAQSLLFFFLVEQ